MRRFALNILKSLLQRTSSGDILSNLVSDSRHLLTFPTSCIALTGVMYRYRSLYIYAVTLSILHQFCVMVSFRVLALPSEKINPTAKTVAWSMEKLKNCVLLAHLLIYSFTYYLVLYLFYDSSHITSNKHTCVSLKQNTKSFTEGKCLKTPEGLIATP